jgi:pyridoxal phosphate-dependent aminotransferase EpsN
MLLSDDAELIERARYLSTQARSRTPHYEHAELGFNYRMSNLCAALGRGQLHGLDRKIARRRAIFVRYADALADLPGITFMPEPAGAASTRWLTVLTIDPALAGTDREAVRHHLASVGIEARPAWKPMHLQPVFAGAQMRGGAVCERIFRDGLCLPSGSGLTDGDIDEVIAGVRAALS